MKSLETGIKPAESSDLLGEKDTTPGHIRRLSERARTIAVHDLLRTGKLRIIDVTTPPIILGEKSDSK